MPIRPFHPYRRVAVLDIGSNSVKLLVADLEKRAKPHVVLQKSKATRLGEGIHSHFQLSKAAIKRTLTAIEKFKQQGNDLHVQEWRTVATSAVREARNGSEFKDLLRRRFNLNLRVLTGDEEAALIFQGAISDPKLFPHRKSILVMDVGGGSAEWIQRKAKKHPKTVCLPLGCVRMTDRFLRGDPYTTRSYRALTAHYLEILAPLRDQFQVKNHEMVGTGGSICTAAALYLHSKSPQKATVHGCKLSLNSLQSLLRELRMMTQAERTRLDHLPRKRADIIVAGLALFVSAMRTFGVRWIRVSVCGLRYGVLLDPSFHL